MVRGVDLDRNYDRYFGEDGSSSDRCSDSYPGGVAFTEPETRAVADFTYTRKVAAAIDFQSYGQFVVFPWSTYPEETPDHTRFSRVGQAIADAMGKTHGTQYTSGARAEVLQPSAGTLIDWLYATEKTLAFAILLRDTGQHGFFLPREQIEPSINEALDGVRSLLSQM